MSRQSAHTYIGCNLEITDGVIKSPSGETQQCKVLTVFDPENNEIHRFPLNEELKEYIVKRLTGGLVVAKVIPTGPAKESPFIGDDIS